ncbi:MAG: hypothetical protein PVI99_06830 [Anaerolineales bacterium]
MARYPQTFPKKSPVFRAFFVNRTGWMADDFPIGWCSARHARSDAPVKKHVQRFHEGKLPAKMKKFSHHGYQVLEALKL